MICLKCNKFYRKKSYFENHVSKCGVVSLPVKTEKTKKEENPIEFLDKEFENIIQKAIKKKNDAEIQDLKEQFSVLSKQFDALKEKVKLIEIMLPKPIEEVMESNDLNNNIKTVRKERMNLDDKIVKEHLDEKNIKSDCQLLYKYYFEDVEKDLYPIKKSGNKKNECIFWNGTDWIEDSGGNYLKDIFSNNLRKVYNKVNIISGTKDVEHVSNHEYINNLSTKKYQSNLYDFFCEYL